MIFDSLLEIIKIKPLNGWFILVSLIIILGLCIWVSYDDVRKQSIFAWKLFLTGSVSILLPFIHSLFSGNGILQPVMYGLALVLYLGLYILNDIFNKNRFIGKGDIDLIAAPFSLCVMASVWKILTTNGPITGMNISYIWFNFLAYLTIGLIIGTIVFMVWFCIEVARGRTGFMLLLRNTKIPAIPTLIPCVVMVSYILMII